MGAKALKRESGMDVPQLLVSLLGAPHKMWRAGTHLHLVRLRRIGKVSVPRLRNNLAALAVAHRPPRAARALHRTLLQPSGLSKS